jgi:hypothetical protein
MSKIIVSYRRSDSAAIISSLLLKESAQSQRRVR